MFDLSVDLPQSKKSIMGALTVIGGTSAFFATSIYLFRRRISKKWLTASSITHHIPLSKKNTIVITGGNSGLGYETALDLARRGAPIILGCRDTVSAEKAVCSIRAATSNENVSYMELDLSSLASVRKFANDLKEKHKNIYALICNAGVWMPMDQKKKTSEGFEIHFGVNHLAHFMLVQELLPLLKNSGMGSRVVFVSSSLSKSGKIDMKSKDFVTEGREQPEKGFAPSGYCDSKLMNALTARYLAKELEGSDVTAYAVCPGFCKSQLGRYVEMPSYKRIIVGPMMRLFQRSAVQGAQNIIYTTVQDTSQLVSGGFYQDGKVNEEMMTSY
jgi:NAD(P)-dependent dehydrogenase (short-subunit alcohol dehydrogenase family)